MSVTSLTIKALGPKGDGIHQGSRGKVYVERTAPGDRIRAKVERDDMGLFRGEVLEILEPSRARQPAPCEHYDRCGNCTVQHVKETFYRKWKEAIVHEAFARQGLAPKRWLKPIFLTGANRRRATFSAIKHRGQVQFGYFRRRSRQISGIRSCLVADPRLLQMRDAIQPHLPALLKDESALDVFLQLVGGSVEAVLTGEIVSRKAAAALSATALARLGWRATERDPIEMVFEKSPLTAEFGPLRVALPPAAFLQPTLEGEAALVRAVLGAVPEKGRFADLFSGCGTFTGPLSARGPVEAFESVPSAVKALTKAGVSAFRRDLFKHPLRREETRKYDAIVFDPPRAGCEAQAENLARSGTPVLVGVSCNPATFARDAAILREGGYWLQSVQVVDQFQWSHHVEMVGVFTRKSRR